MFDESEAEPTTAPDTNNQTKFHPDEADTDEKYRGDGTATFEQHYTRLASLNGGVFTGKWADKQALHQQDNAAIFDAIAGQLELTDHQKRVGRQQFEDLNLRTVTTPNAPIAVSAILTAAVVARRDGRKYHPQASDENNDGLFVALLAEFEVADSTLNSLYGKVHYRIEGER